MYDSPQIIKRTHMKCALITKLYTNNIVLVQPVPNFLFGLPKIKKIKNSLIKNSSPSVF